MIEKSVAWGNAHRITREERGIVLFRERGDEIEHIKGRSWLVPACMGSTRYLVDLKHECCECPDTPPAGELCKHTVAATIARAKSGGCASCSRVIRYRDLHVVGDGHPIFFEGDGLCERCALDHGVL